MTELILHPVPPLDRVTLAQLHDSLAMLGPTDTARLLLEPGAPALSPLDFGRAAQLILAWGASPSRTILEARGVNLLSADSVAGLKDIDNLLLAVSLADQVLDDTGEDVSASWRHVVAKMMSSKLSLGDIDLHDTSNESAAIFLLGHSPRFDHSTDLHAVEDGEWKVDEEARTLYHSLWPEPDKPTSIRDPLFHLGERRHVSDRGVSYIRRELWPDRSPGFRTLAERTLNPSGRIRDRAIAYRAREKTPEDEIGEVLFELVQNTEWHGQGNLPGPRASGFRLIRFQTCTYTRDDVPILAERDSGFAEYIGAAIQDLESSSSEEPIKLTLGVATIIDCGVGLARRAAIMRDELHLFAPENEISYLGRALSKPTRTIFRKMGSIGLPRVQILMTNLRGFMTIRTGTVELRRDFIANPIRPNAKPLFIEWIPEDFEDFYVGRRYGTDVTIVVPLSCAEMTQA